MKQPHVVGESRRGVFCGPSGKLGSQTFEAVRVLTNTHVWDRVLHFPQTVEHMVITPAIHNTADHRWRILRELRRTLG